MKILGNMQKIFLLLMSRTKYMPAQFLIPCSHKDVKVIAGETKMKVYFKATV